MMRRHIPLRPAMCVKSMLCLVKQVEEGTSVSYGRRFTADHRMRVGTLPIGYADGYPRALSSKGWAMIHGKKAPVLGRVGMDQLMVDLTDIPEAQVGDEAVLFGAEPTADDLAAQYDAIGYELICGVSRRVPRVYLRRGRPISVENRMHQS